jgi:hypothetical protein
MVKKKTKTKKKVATKKKTVIKKKPAKKTTTRKKVAKKIVKKTTTRKEPVNFGLLQHEIDELMNCQVDNKDLNQDLSKQLAKLLPDNKPLTKHEAQRIDVVVQNINKRAAHSPYVVDLAQAANEKKGLAEKKQFIFNFINNPHKHVNQTKAEPENVKTIIKGAITQKQIKGHEVKIQETEITQVEDEGSYDEQFTKKPLFYNWNLPLHWHRAIITYVMIALIIILPIKGFSYYQDLSQTKEEVTTYAKSAYSDLKIAGDSISQKNLAGANESFTKANYNFKKASVELENVNNFIKTVVNLIPSDNANLADAEYILEIGEKTTNIANQFTSLLDNFSQNENSDLTDKLVLFQDQLNELIPELTNINQTINKIRVEAIPTEFQDKFGTIKSYLATLTNDIQELNSLSTTLLDVLGHDLDRTYLFVFQNSNELRPSGGFMGSFAVVDFSKGTIKNLDIPGGGIYAMQGSLSVKTKPPLPIQELKDVWEMQDANWFPDFKTTAEKVKWFYEKSGGETVDGVIAINSTIIPKLLELTGPIEMPEYNTTITSTNFIHKTQEQVELLYDKEENQPKQILSDLAPILLEKLFNTDTKNVLNVAKIFVSSLNEKEIQLYFRNEAVQEKFSNYDWTGEIKNSSRDYLMIANANIRGGKTDDFIDQVVNLDSQIQENGEIINTVTVTRKHTATQNDLFGNQENIDYMRIYTPQGSQFISAEGFSDAPANVYTRENEALPNDTFLENVQGETYVEPASQTIINNEFDKTVFGNWIKVKPGLTKTITLKYKLPFKYNFDNQDKNIIISKLTSNQESVFHSIFIQKQSGQQNSSYNINLQGPNNKNLEILYNNEAIQDNNQIYLNSDNKTDELLAVSIK